MSRTESFNEALDVVRNEALNEAAWAQALLQVDAKVPPGWVACNGSDARVRLNVYRNNVWASLCQAMADTFPTLYNAMGDALFGYAALRYVQSQPPSDVILAHYGQGFAEFLAQLGRPKDAPASALAWPDVAQLEYAHVQCFHAADASPAHRSAWENMLNQPELLAHAVFNFAPSVQVVHSAWPICQLWLAWQEGLAEPEGLHNAPESALVCRQGWDVVVVPLSPALGQCVGQLLHGATLGEAARVGLHHAADFDLSMVLSVLLQHGCVTEVRLAESTDEHVVRSSHEKARTLFNEATQKEIL